jgi:hypothetical protein
MNGSIPPFPNTPPWRGAQLKHRDNFTFTFLWVWNLVSNLRGKPRQTVFENWELRRNFGVMREMGRACSTDGTGKKCIHNFGRET